MNTAPEVYVGPAFRGWRSWRIMPFEKLGEPMSVRLCASGTRGLPKVWEPARPMRGVCGKFGTTHDAPWPDCECGFYAYRERWRAEDHLAVFADGKNGNGALGWAFGEVSLWGRIVEHADGYRSEWAYPYAITVFGSETLARQLRELYGIDVDVRPTESLPQLEPEDEEEEETASAAELIGRAEQAVRRAQVALSRPAPAAPSVWQLLRDEDRLAGVLMRANSVMTAREFLIKAMAETGTEDYEPSPSAVSSAGAYLYQLAMRHNAVRYACRDGRKRWASHSGAPDAPEGSRIDDPTLEHLERDLPMITAAAAVAGPHGQATAKEILAQLASSLGKPQVAQAWSATFARCRLRGWMFEAAPRTYMLGSYGRKVAERGSDLPSWPGYHVPGHEQIVLAELHAAASAAGGYAESWQVAERFRERSWSLSGPVCCTPDCHSVAQRMLHLERAGLVESKHVAKHPVLWRPTGEAVDHG